jgi:hypothetical protein
MRASMPDKAAHAGAFYDARFRPRRCRMKFATMVVLAGIGCAGSPCAPAQAAGQAAGAVEGGWTEAQSLRELPAGLQAFLGVGLGAAGIADRGEAFNETDVGVDSMPRRRFLLGAVNGDTVIVALEQGGRGYSVRAVEFKQQGRTWEPVRCTYLNGLPVRGAELVGALAGNKGGACRTFGILPAGPDPVAVPVVPARVRPRPAT